MRVASRLESLPAQGTLLSLSLSHVCGCLEIEGNKRKVLMLLCFEKCEGKVEELTIELGKRKKKSCFSMHNKREKN